jgi:hypothetical protein
MYNLYQQRRLLKKQLEKESSLTRMESMKALYEFEKMMDDD